MRVLRFIGAAFVVLTLVALVPIWASTASADTDTGGAAIGPKPEVKTDPGKAHAPAMSGDIVVRELGKGSEQPMRVPDSEEGGGMEFKHMLVPNQADFEAAQESDSVSALSF